MTHTYYQYKPKPERGMEVIDRIYLITVLHSLDRVDVNKVEKRIQEVLINSIGNFQRDIKLGKER